MIFLFSTNPSHFDQLKNIIQKQSPLPIATACAGDEWGAVVATETPYLGLNPVRKNEEVIVTLGDPLIDLPPVTITTKRCRSEAILKKWNSGGCIFPEHAAALIKVDFLQKTCVVVTDCCASIPIFTGKFGDSTVVSNSPDLVEMVVQSGPDIISFRERLAALQNAFPYTLYKGVTQTYPGAVTTITDRRTKIERWWSAPPVDNDIVPDSAREELQSIAADQMRRMVTQIGSKGALTMSAGADSRFAAAVCATSCAPEDLTAICQTVVPDLESETARKVATALGMNFVRATRPEDHYPRFVLSVPFYMGSHVAWDHGHFGMSALGMIGDAKFILGGYWADSLFDDADMWNTIKSRYQESLISPISDGSRMFSASSAFSYLSEESKEVIGARWLRARRELGLGSEYSSRLAGIYPASRSLAAAHVAVTRFYYPDYQLFMNRRSVDLAFRLSAEFKEAHGKSFLLSSYDERLRNIPINPGQSRKIRAIVAKIRTEIPAALWPSWVHHHGSWRFIEGNCSRRLYRASRLTSPRLANAVGLPAAAIPFRRNLSQATKVFQLGQVLGL